MSLVYCFLRNCLWCSSLPWFLFFLIILRINLFVCLIFSWINRANWSKMCKTFAIVNLLNLYIFSQNWVHHRLLVIYKLCNNVIARIVSCIKCILGQFSILILFLTLYIKFLFHLSRITLHFLVLKLCQSFPFLFAIRFWIVSSLKFMRNGIVFIIPFHVLCS